MRFIPAASLVHEQIEAKNEHRLMRFQKMLSSSELLIIDELGFVPLSKIRAELLFEVFSRRYERSSTLVISNLPFNERTEAFGSERLTGALLDRFASRGRTPWPSCVPVVLISQDRDRSGSRSAREIRLQRSAIARSAQFRGMRRWRVGHPRFPDLRDQPGHSRIAS